MGRGDSIDGYDGMPGWIHAAYTNKGGIFSSVSLSVSVSVSPYRRNNY